MKPLQITMTNAHVPTFWQRCARLCSRHCHWISMPTVRGLCKTMQAKWKVFAAQLIACAYAHAEWSYNNQFTESANSSCSDNNALEGALFQECQIVAADMHLLSLCALADVMQWWILFASISPFWWVAQIQRLAQRQESVPRDHTNQHPVHMIHFRHTCGRNHQQKASNTDTSWHIQSLKAKQQSSVC